jgi:hypothetical protein
MRCVQRSSLECLLHDGSEDGVLHLLLSHQVVVSFLNHIMLHRDGSEDRWSSWWCKRWRSSRWWFKRWRSWSMMVVQPMEQQMLHKMEQPSVEYLLYDGSEVQKIVERSLFWTISCSIPSTGPSYWWFRKWSGWWPSRWNNGAAEGWFSRWSSRRWFRR